MLLFITIENLNEECVKMKKLLKILIVFCAFLMVFSSGSVFSSYLGKDNMAHAYSPNVQIHGPFYTNFKGTTLNSRVAKYSPASLNLQAAAGKAVLSKYGKISSTKTYKIKWYQKITYSAYGLSYNGSITNVSCIN